MSKADQLRPRSTLTRKVAGWSARRGLSRQASSRAARRQMFDLFPPSPESTVFLGDSLTEGGEWGEWLPEAQAVNRGIGGDTAADILDRLDSAIVEPRHVLLLVGTNDLSTGLDATDVAKRILDLSAAIHDRAPLAEVLIQSLLPRAPRFAHEIETVNACLQMVESPGVRYVDLWSSFVTPCGGIDPELSFDELHLNARGYARWLEVIRPLTSDGRSS